MKCKNDYCEIVFDDQEQADELECNDCTQVFDTTSEVEE